MSEDIKKLLEDISRELDNEDAAKRTPEEAQLHSFCQQLLCLERDLRAPGAARTEDDRVDRILADLRRATLK